jgi:DinB superfamily
MFDVRYHRVRQLPMSQHLEDRVPTRDLTHKPANASAGCSICGFQPISGSVIDAIPAILSIPTSYRAMLEHAGPLDQIDALVRTRPSPGAWSTLECVAHVGEVLHVAANHLVSIFDDTRRELPPHIEAPSAISNTTALRVVCAQLVAAAARLAQVVNGTAPEAWTRTARRGQITVSAAELLREALLDAHHHLHDIELALAFPATHSLAS